MKIKKDQIYMLAGCWHFLQSALVFLSIMRIEYALTSTLGSLSFAFVIWNCCERLNIKNKLLNFGGIMSWEFYLCHTRILFIGQNYFAETPVLWFVFSLLGSVIIAMFFNFVMKLIVKILI